jgi:hypothetical protein
MLVRIIGLIGFLMIMLGYKRFYRNYRNIVILGIVIEGKSMIVVGSFILVGVMLLIYLNIA